MQSSIFLPPTMAGRVCRIILVVLVLALGALFALQATGTSPNSSMLMPGILLLAMLNMARAFYHSGSQARPYAAFGAHRYHRAGVH